MRRVFNRPVYILLAFLIGAFVFLAITWIPLIPLLLQILSSPNISLSNALMLSFDLLRFSFSDLTAQDVAYAGILSLLTGVNVALLLFYRRMYRSMPSGAEASGSVVGMTAAFLGLGCAACGSLLLFSIAGTVGGAALIALLPYGGAEIGFVGLALLALSTFLLVRTINKSSVCPT